MLRSNLALRNVVQVITEALGENIQTSLPPFVVCNEQPSIFSTLETTSLADAVAVFESVRVQTDDDDGTHPNVLH